MQIAFRTLSILVGLAMLWNGVGFLLDPAGATEGLGMELLTGVGASTQLGDLSAFFVSIAAFVGLGQRRGAAHWLLAAAVLLGGAAVMRTAVTLAGHAPLTPQFIVPELVMTAILVTAARLRRNETASD